MEVSVARMERGTVKRRENTPQLSEGKENSCMSGMSHRTNGLRY